MKLTLTLLTALLLGSGPHLGAAEPQCLDALGNTGWFQGMWPSDASMPTPRFPRFQVETTNGSIVVARKFPMDPALEAKEPVIRLTLAGQRADWQVAYRFGNLLRLASDTASVEMMIVSHRLVLFRVRQTGKAPGTLRAEGVELVTGRSPDETLAVAACDDAARAEGRAHAARFDELWATLARPQDIEPFLTGTETPVERNLIAACVNRVLRNARGGGFIRTASLVEFFGPEWHTADAVWICFQPACRYVLWIEPSFWANSMRTLLDRQAVDGRVPQAVYQTRAMGNSQIPNISPCLRDYYVFTHDRQFLAETYPRFKRWYEWWLKQRNPTGDGIIAVGSANQEQMTSVYEYKDNHPKYHGGFMPLTRTPELDGRPERVYLPDIVACQARMAEDLAFMAGELGLEEDAVHFTSEYRRIRDWANKNLWDEETKFYYPVIRATGKKLMKRSNVAFWLLWAGIPDDRQKTALVEAMFDPKQFFTTIPLPLISLNDPSFDSRCGHWGDGYVWPIDVFHAFDGLLRYREWDNAAKLAEHYNRGVFAAIQDSLRPNEYYHHSGRTAGNPIMGTAGCLPLTFQRYLKDYKAGKAQAEWAKFAPHRK